MRFKAGDRVKMMGSDFYSGVMEGAEGTAKDIRGWKGVSVYPDPMKRLIFVDWDEYGQVSVPVKLVERIKHGLSLESELLNYPLDEIGSAVQNRVKQLARESRQVVLESVNAPRRKRRGI